MLKWINNIIESKQEQERLAELAKKILAQQADREKLTELIDLRRITIGNVRYLRSYLNTLNSVSNCIKGGSAAETRKKRQGAKAQIKWVAGKLKEEESMEIYFNQRVQEQGKLIA